MVVPVHGVIRPANGHAATWIWRSGDCERLAVVREREERKKALRAERDVLLKLVLETTKILRHGMSAWAHEGAMRGVLRIFFILECHRPWRLADWLAWWIIDRALSDIGAVRPSWWQGQREYARTKGSGCFYCENAECGKPIERTSHQVMRYCSEECRLATKSKRSYQEHAESRIAYAAARRVAVRETGEVRTCQWCGSLFRAAPDRADRKPQAYCSASCRSAFASSCATSWRPARIRGRDGRFVGAE